MNFQSAIEGPLLYTTFIVFFWCLLLRAVFFTRLLFKKSCDHQNNIKFFVLSFLKIFVPGHRFFAKSPVYTIVRYCFHFCLISVPIWFAGHVMVLEQSSLKIGYLSMGYEWSNKLTLLVILMLVFFFFRRVFINKECRDSSRHDYFFLLLTALPYFTGYLLANNTIENLIGQPGFLNIGDTLWTIHILSGEFFLLGVSVLFVRTRINPKQCTACTACVANCPTNALLSEDASRERTISYSHYQCLCCANCAQTCPEKAIMLRHELGLGLFFQIREKRKIRSEPLCKCEKCSNYFIPNAQFIKIQDTISTTLEPVCQSCRQKKVLEPVRYGHRSQIK